MNYYIIAEEVGGLMEMPEITYMNFDIIKAKDEETACEIYDIKHNCNYFYGDCVGIYNPKTNKVALKRKYIKREYGSELKDAIRSLKIK